MDLVYFNPNNYGVDLKNIDCDVYIEHNYLGKYVLDTTMHIAKKSEFVVPSKMQVNMKNLFKNTNHLPFFEGITFRSKRNHKGWKSGHLYYCAV
jgi:LEA14-like dessication related protein